MNGGEQAFEAWIILLNLNVEQSCKIALYQSSLTPKNSREITTQLILNIKRVVSDYSQNLKSIKIPIYSHEELKHKIDQINPSIIIEPISKWIKRLNELIYIYYKSSLLINYPKLQLENYRNSSEFSDSFILRLQQVLSSSANELSVILSFEDLNNIVSMGKISQSYYLDMNAALDNSPNELILNNKSKNYGFILKSIATAIFIFNVPNLDYINPADINRNHRLIIDYKVINRRLYRTQASNLNDSTPNLGDRVQSRLLSNKELLESIGEVVQNKPEYTPKILKFLDDTNKNLFYNRENTEYLTGSNFKNYGEWRVENKYIKEDLSADEIMRQFNFFSNYLLGLQGNLKLNPFDDVMLNEFNFMDEQQKNAYFSELRNKFFSLNFS